MERFLSTPVEKARVGVLGVSYDAGNKGIRGAASAPNVLDHYLQYAETFEPARGDLLDQPIAFLGRISPENYTELVEQVSQKVADARQANPGIRFLFIGGDHTITQVTARALNAQKILWVDAHPDYYDELEGDRHSQATSARRLAEQGAEIVMRGIRSVSRQEYAALNQDDVDWSDDLSSPHKVNYLSLDVDVLDPSLVATSWPEAPGKPLSSVLRLIRATEFAHADLVEWVPDKGWPQLISLFRELCWGLLGK